MRKFDRVIIGAGIFGLYAAKVSSNKGYKTLVIDIDDSAFLRASSINQARIHNGYHYPRSLATAIKSAEYFNKFNEDFKDCINKSFKKIYAISNHYSWTGSKEFTKFCDNAGIPCEEVQVSNYFNELLIESAFETLEYSFDSSKIRNKLLSEISSKHITFEFGTELLTCDNYHDYFHLKLSNNEIISTNWILNATYSGINSINNKLGLSLIETKYELCEICMVDVSENIRNIGLTVMDGPFFSLMPFGCSSKHSLTTVVHTPHKASTGSYPIFDCQQLTKGNCSGKSLQNCNNCTYKPESSFDEMCQLANKYLHNSINIVKLDSIFCVKTILNTSEVDDSRPTLISSNLFGAKIYSVFSGKINTIYDLESIL